MRARMEIPMATSKKLEGAFRYLSSYDGKEYRALDGTPESFLLKIIYSSSSGGATFIGSQHIDRHRERSSRIIKGIVSSFNSYLKRTPIARRLVMVEGFSGDPHLPGHSGKIVRIGRTRRSHLPCKECRDRSVLSGTNE